MYFFRFCLHEWKDCNLGACHYQSEQSEHLVIQKLNATLYIWVCIL